MVDSVQYRQQLITFMRALLKAYFLSLFLSIHIIAYVSQKNATFQLN